MSNKIYLELVTPDKLLISKEVDIVVATGVEGEFGVLVGHAPFLTALAIGELRYRDGNNIDYAAVSGGFCEVTGSKIVVLAEAAELAHYIDIDRAKRAQVIAEQRLATKHTEEFNYAHVEAALRRSIIRIRVAGRISS